MLFNSLSLQICTLNTHQSIYTGWSDFDHVWEQSTFVSSFPRIEQTL